MKVIRARRLGYCMGVRRAVRLAYAEAEKNAGRVYTAGPLIHNPQVLEDLRRRGVEVLDDTPGRLPELSGAVVIIRAHGITPRLETELSSRAAVIVDATCPKVKASQTKARDLSEAGYRIFLAGEKLHGEVIGIQGYAPDCIIVANPEEAQEAGRMVASGGNKDPDKAPLKTALMGQTTISPEEYRAIAQAITAYLPRTEIINTLCPATKERQDALRALSREADALIIAGGRESANTRRLLAIAQAEGRSCDKPAWLVESPEELPPGLAAYGAIGLSAGASTPDEVIDAIERAINSNSKFK
ncbi:MAG: 4-hydroxy-3-methylbut-2-enyl diphosphate reductase [Treponema sp.]|jgi:4-hydroxy-3-methylbut-2-enyl diphosphate reductase|nr:4-hydroxy-3-methylbut-2-enyl diphosphate reductase [Treponema sp.]